MEKNKRFLKLIRRNFIKNFLPKKLFFRRPILLLFLLILTVATFIIYSTYKTKYLGENNQETLYSHLKTYASVYGAIDAHRKSWIASHIDLSGGTASTNRSLYYVSWSDLDQTRAEYDVAYKEFINKGLDFDDAFFHYKNDAVYTKNTTTNSIKEGRFSGVYISDSYTSKTNQAYGDIGTGDLDIPFGSSPTNSLYLAHNWKFRVLEFNLSRPASNGWVGNLEYHSGNEWKRIPNETVVDDTNNLKSSGKIIFSPPDDWVRSNLNNSNYYWLRIVCSQGCNDASNPIARTHIDKNTQYEWEGTAGVRTESYSDDPVDSKNFIIPGWDPVNDVNNDGFVNDAEFSIRANKSASARFKYQSRAPSTYKARRWVINIDHPTLVNLFVEDTHRRRNIAGYSGIFLDNAWDVIPDISKGRKQYLEIGDENPNPTYSGYTVHLINQIKNRIQGELMVNGNFDTFRDMGLADGIMTEGRIKYPNSKKETEYYLKDFKIKLDDFCALGKSVIVHADPSPYYTSPSFITPVQKQMYSLSRYYLTSNDCSYLKYQNSINGYATPWEDWFSALEYDVGRPLSEFQTLTTTRRNYDPDNPPVNLLANYSFEDDLIGWGRAIWRGTVSFVTDNSVSKVGNKSMKISSSSEENSGGVYQYVNLKPNTTYTVGTWLKASLEGPPNSTPVSLFIYPGPGGATGNLSRYYSKEIRDWTHLSATFKTGNSTEGAYVYAGRLYYAKGDLWIDGVTVEEGDSPHESVFVRDYENAKILLRPVADSIGDPFSNDPGLNIDLGGRYRQLFADGTLGGPIERVTIKNYEGIILVPETEQPLPIASIDGSVSTYERMALNLEPSVQYADKFQWLRLSGPDNSLDFVPLDGRSKNISILNGSITGSASSYKFKFVASNSRGISSGDKLVDIHIHKLADIDGELNERGKFDVDFDDFTTLLSNWGTPVNPMANINRSGTSASKVDFDDFTALLFNWGK